MYRANDIADEFGTRKGKGEALWKSLFVVTGDVLVFVDGDLTRVGAALRDRAARPAPGRPEVLLVRAAYARLRTRCRGTVRRRRSADGTCRTPTINLHWPLVAWPSHWPASGRPAAA